LPSSSKDIGHPIIFHCSFAFLRPKIHLSRCLTFTPPPKIRSLRLLPQPKTQAWVQKPVISLSTKAFPQCPSNIHLGGHLLGRLVKWFCGVLAEVVAFGVIL
jgi:hypothetical protein